MMNMLDTDMRYLALDVIPTPKGANGWPSSEYCKGPPGVCMQWYMGTRALIVKTSVSHCRINCLIYKINYRELFS